jgi:hypothetical protein
MDGRKSGEGKRAWGGALFPFPRTTLERPLRTRAQLRHVVLPHRRITATGLAVLLIAIYTELQIAASPHRLITLIP